MNMTFLARLASPRLLNLGIFLFCSVLLLIALYMQYGMGMEPCPLCMTQRIFFIAVGLTGLLAFAHNPAGAGQIAYGGAAALLAAGGGGFAMRQIYLQNLPADQVPMCGPSLSYMLEEFPLGEVLAIMVRGDGNCAEVAWRDPVLAMSIPQWSLAGFAMLLALSLFQIIRAMRQSRTG